MRTLDQLTVTDKIAKGDQLDVEKSEIGSICSGFVGCVFA